MTEIVSLGTQLHLIVLPIAMSALVVLAAVAVLFWRRTEDDLSGWGITFGFLAVCAALTGLAWAIAAIPYDSKYWGLYSVSGHVEAVSNGIAQGDGITYRTYIVEFDGDNRPYRFDDARITTLEGEQIEALCTIEWVYMAADKWNCEIRSAGFAN